MCLCLCVCTVHRVEVRGQLSFHAPWVLGFKLQSPLWVSFQGVMVQKLLESQVPLSAGSHARRAGGLRCLLSAVNSDSGATPLHSTLLVPSGWRGRGRYYISWLDCFIKVYQATDGHCPMFSRPESETKAQEGLVSLKTHKENYSLFLSRVQWPSIFSSFWFLSSSLQSLSWHLIVFLCVKCPSSYKGMSPTRVGPASVARWNLMVGKDPVSKQGSIQCAF